MFTVALDLFAAAFALNGLTPLYPDVARDLGVGVDTFGILLAIQGAINVTLQLPVGVAADRVGRHPVMLLGLIFMAAGMLVRGVSGTPVAFGISQVLVGLCGPCVVAAGYAVVADAYHALGRAQAIGVLSVAVSLGQGAGFLFAGLLAPSIGWRGYSLAVAALPILLLFVSARLPIAPPLHASGSLGMGMRTALRFLIDPGATSLAAVTALCVTAYVGSTYLLPFVAHDLRIGALAIGLLLVPLLIGAIIGGPLAGRWADRVGVRTPALTAIAVSTLAVVALGVFGFNPTLVVACYLIIGAGVTAIVGLAAVHVVDLANHRGVGTGAALGGLRLGQGLGPALAPPLTGLLFIQSGPSFAYFALAGGLVVAGGLVYVATSHEHRSPEPVQ